MCIRDRFLIFLLPCLGLTADYPLRARCIIQSDSGSKLTGNIVFIQRRENAPVYIMYYLKGLTSNNEHGFHIHEKADYSQKCNSTGGHWNPHGKHHGGPNQEDRHVGDLGNIRSNGRGHALYSQVDKVISLSGKNSIVGLPCVIHGGRDDLGLGHYSDSLVNGHSGPRIGCGTVTLF
eukprot:TRINITY_DN5972_c0_g1_i1.p1 TRINITY_DN5972_c0_g1~~TRINITY_DN5972_c0_g1_i1.p1  ORF type:complete len:197 (-),score=33.77 TRINITY_DN5972_c0_g1_i1:89-619(-)